MERLVVFEAHEAPDAALDHLERELRRQGFTVEPGQWYDLVGKRGVERVFVGIGPHPKGLAARIKTKALVPGRGDGLLRSVETLVAERLGRPVARVKPTGGPER